MAKKKAKRACISRDMNDNLIAVGDRVEIHPGFDLWMRGAKYGTVTGCSGSADSQKFHVRMDNRRVRRLLRAPADRLKVIR